MNTTLHLCTYYYFLNNKNNNYVANEYKNIHYKNELFGERIRLIKKVTLYF